MLYFTFMKRRLLFTGLLFALLPALTRAAAPTAQMKSAIAFIANYSNEGNFLGWGSGFYVDEGIVVTNKHVIDDGDWYRVYGTGDDDSVDLDCYRAITKTDVKINLDDDVAYMRAYLPCTHGVMDFHDDPWQSDPVSILGYPYKGSVEASMHLTITSGKVTGTTSDGWLSTDAPLDVGNSGGPVVDDSGVLGVAVAKGIDSDGNFVEGYFIPSSVILKGLLYANNSDFGYVPRSQSSSSRRSSSSSSLPSVSSSASSASSRSSSSSSSSSHTSSFSSRSSSRSSLRPAFPDVPVVHPAYQAILNLRDRGIIAGYSDGTFRPAGTINRAEFLKILMAGFKSEELRGESRCFTDVGSEWFAPYVCAAKRQRWIAGYQDGTFKPGQLINRAEAMKILISVFGQDSVKGVVPRDVRVSAWFYPYVAQGVQMGIVNPDVPFRPGDDLTRGEAAMWIDGAMQK